MTPYNCANRNLDFFSPIYSPSPSVNKPIQSKEEKRKYKAWSTAWSQNCTSGGWPKLGKPLLTFSRVCSPKPVQDRHKDSLAPSVCYFGLIPLPREVTNNLFLPMSSANHPTFPYLKWRIGRLMRCRSHICSLNTPESFQPLVYL